MVVVVGGGWWFSRGMGCVLVRVEGGAIHAIVVLACGGSRVGGCVDSKSINSGYARSECLSQGTGLRIYPTLMHGRYPSPFRPLPSTLHLHAMGSLISVVVKNIAPILSASLHTSSPLYPRSR